MIKIAFFDVGETLIHNGRMFSGVVSALTAIARFETTNVQPLFMGIISDYFMPNPRTEEKITALEEQYRNQVLEPSGLTRFFDPFESRVTISSRAGASKPAAKIFEVALARSGLTAALTECLFVTENMEHLERCKDHGITPVRFGPAAAGMAGFENWAEAPIVIARLVAPGHLGNQALAHAARHGLIDFKITGTQDRIVRGQASQRFQLNDPRLGSLDGIHVERPTEVTVEFGPDGQVTSFIADSAEPDEIADAVNFVSTLLKSGSVAGLGQQAPSFGVTHAVEQDAEGRMQLVRRSYAGR